jgi:hypothetical protein
MVLLPSLFFSSVARLISLYEERIDKIDTDEIFEPNVYEWEMLVFMGRFNRTRYKRIIHMG